MHLSLVVSPVLPLTLSLLAVRDADADVIVGVAGVPELADADRLPWYPSAMQRPLARSYAPASATLPFGVTLAVAPCACCFSLSTACFHFLTISFAKSETSFALCVLSLPTAKPILLSCVAALSVSSHKRHDRTRKMKCPPLVKTQILGSLSSECSKCQSVPKSNNKKVSDRTTVKEEVLPTGLGHFAAVSRVSSTQLHPGASYRLLDYGPTIYGVQPAKCIDDKRYDSEKRHQRGQLGRGVLMLCVPPQHPTTWQNKRLALGHVHQRCSTAARKLAQVERKAHLWDICDGSR